MNTTGVYTFRSLSSPPPASSGKTLGSGGGDPYTQEQGPGNISRLTRLMMDLHGSGPGKTKDAYGTEADVRAISTR